MSDARKARMVGFNHVALEVGDIEAALDFYGRLFAFELRSKSDSMAFIDLGDQFIALQKGRAQPADDGRHFGLVVDDKEVARKALADAGIETLSGPFLDFLDRGATASRSSAMKTYSSRKRRTSCAAWDSHTFRRARLHWRNSAPRAWRRTERRRVGRAHFAPGRPSVVRPTRQR